VFVADKESSIEKRVDGSKLLTNLVNNQIHRAIEKIDKSEQLQSVIYPELHFRRNSLNLYIGRRGSGKTFNVLRELIKLSKLPGHGGYNLFLYVTDKSNDSTVNELVDMINLKTKVISYADTAVYLADLAKAKTAYEEIVRKDLTEDVTDDCKRKMMKAVMPDYWGAPTPHTVVLYDDAINVFKTAKYKVLYNLLFQNRQPKITYFMCIQDGFGIPAAIERNLDSCIIFGGYTDGQMLGMLFTQLGTGGSTKMLMDDYRQCSSREGIIFDYHDGTEDRLEE
jgi:hypothetical protein